MSPTPEDILAILGSLGIALCCGLPLLLFAGITFYAARKHGQNVEGINLASPARVAGLKAGTGLVRLEGLIGQVSEKLDGPPDSPLALVRLRVERRDPDDGNWNGSGDGLRASPFRLDDESGSVWVDPQGLDKISLGEGWEPADVEIGTAAAMLAGVAPASMYGETRLRMWELRGGQRVTVIGSVLERGGQLVVAKAPKSQLIITSLLGPAVQVQTAQQVKTAWGMTLLLGIPGLLGVCIGLGFLVFSLLRLF